MRLTFDQMYPGAPDGFEPHGENVSKIPGDPEPCVVCGRPTHWADFSFECWFCSPACEDKMWEDYWEACRRCPGSAHVDY